MVEKHPDPIETNRHDKHSSLLGKYLGSDSYRPPQNEPTNHRRHVKHRAVAVTALRRLAGGWR